MHQGYPVNPHDALGESRHAGMLLPAKRVPGGLSACLGPTRERRGLSPTTPRSVQLRRLCSQTGLCCVELVIRQSLVNQGSRVCSQCMWDLGTPQSHKIALPPHPPHPGTLTASLSK